jgi:hypothetical protein
MTPMARELSASSTLRSDMHRIRRSLDSLHALTSSTYTCKLKMQRIYGVPRTVYV